MHKCTVLQVRIFNQDKMLNVVCVVLVDQLKVFVEDWRFKDVLAIVMLSEEKEQVWQVKSFAMATVPPLKLQFAHVTLDASIVSFTPFEMLNVQELQYDG